MGWVACFKWGPWCCYWSDPPKKLMSLKKFAKISQGLSDIFHCHGQSRLLSHWHHLMFDAGFHCGCMEHEEGRDSPLVGTWGWRFGISTLKPLKGWSGGCCSLGTPILVADIVSEFRFFWVFPKIMVFSPNHPLFTGFSIILTIHLG